MLTVDVWNAEDHTHFGSVRVPLARLLRQGQPSNVQSFQLDVYEPNANLWVGELMLQITNQGKRVDLEDLKAQNEGANASKQPAGATTIKKTGTAGKAPHMLGGNKDVHLSASASKPTKKVRSVPLDQKLQEADQQT